MTKKTQQQLIYQTSNGGEIILTFLEKDFEVMIGDNEE